LYISVKKYTTILYLTSGFIDSELFSGMRMLRIR
jgi:hypothetical protein